MQCAVQARILQQPHMRFTLCPCPLCQLRAASLVTASRPCPRCGLLVSSLAVCHALCLHCRQLLTQPAASFNRAPLSQCNLPSLYPARADSASLCMQELVQQILRLTPFGLAHSFLGAPSLPVNGSSGLANGHLKTNGTVQARHAPATFGVTCRSLGRGAAQPCQQPRAASGVLRRQLASQNES